MLNINPYYELGRINIKGLMGMRATQVVIVPLMMESKLKLFCSFEKGLSLL